MRVVSIDFQAQVYEGIRSFECDNRAIKVPLMDHSICDKLCVFLLMDSQTRIHEGSRNSARNA